MNYNKLVTLKKTNVKNKVVFLRLDLNVPIIDGKITSFKRINETLETIQYLQSQNAKIVILSHFGRPKTLDDIKSGKFSLKPVADALFKKLKVKGKFLEKNKGQELIDAVNNLKFGEILVLENTRYNDVCSDNGKLINRESECDISLANEWASLCDVFVNDAFGAAHRQHASNFGIASLVKKNCIGFLMERELKTLSSVVKNSKSPFVVIFGGAKISDKLKAVNAVIERADKVIISGGMAYTFVAAQGYDVGLSMVETSMIDVAKDLMAKYPNKLCISNDFMCAKEFKDQTPVYRTQEEGMKGYMGLDIGPRSIEQFVNVINTANTIMWNGPMGVTEFSNFEKGTNEICNAIAKRTLAGAQTIIGGGDSAAAAEKLKKEKSFSFISTGGGASLRLIEGSELGGLKANKKRFF